MALTKIKADGLTADLIDETKLADNSIDSEHYNDGSIDNAHLADDAVGIAELSATGTASSSTFLRGDNSWATPTATTINNNADNRVITGSGTANTLEGEANLTFSGGATGDATLTVHAEENNNASEAFLKLETSNDFAESIVTAHDSSGVGGSLKYNHGDNAWRFTTNGDSERMRIDSSGRLLLGTSSGTGHSLTGSNNPLLQIESASSNDYGRASFIFNGATAVGPGLWFGKSRGTSVGSNTIVNDGDQCGGFFFHAADGTDKYSRVASIQVSVDGTPGSNDTPGRISFSTTSDGSDGTTERMRINSDGIITQPYKPSFFATINGGDNTTNDGGIIPFANAKHNTGSHFNTSTYKFIAPVAGVYFFCTQIWAKNGTNNARFRFAVDDASNSYSTDNISQNGFHGNSVNREDFGYNASIVWYLDEGDRFYVKVDNTNLTYYTAGASDPHSYFCGHFIG